MEDKSTESYADKRSVGMATAALVLGICGIATGLCPYGGFILGALAIILGLLSRGGEMTMSVHAKAGVILGAIGMGLSTIVTCVCLALGAFEIVDQQQNTHLKYDYEYYAPYFDDDYNDYYDHHENHFHDYDFHNTF